MKKSTIAAALVLASGMIWADVVSRTEYPNAARAHTRDGYVATDADQAEFWSPIAIGFVPRIQFPGPRQRVMALRLNILAGRNLDVYGLDVGGLGNLVTHDFGGLQVATLFNVIGESSGCVQIAGILNNCQGDLEGVQFGLINVAEKGYGFQLGLVNYGNVFHGVQIGAVNVIKSSNCPVMPILNFAF